MATETASVTSQERATAQPVAQTIPAKAVPTSGSAIPVGFDPTKSRVIVARRLDSDRVYEPGEVIELAGRRRDVLVRGRFLREFAYGEKIYRCACGRMWVDEEQAKGHHCGS